MSFSMAFLTAARFLRAAALSGDPTLARDARGAPYFGRADVFVSYFWAAPLSELLAALDDGGGASTGARFFWVDIFAVGQCKHTPAAAAYNKADVSAFETVLAAVGATWLWCKPWHAPATFGRVWCLFEALKTVDLGKELVLVMAADEQAALRATLLKRFKDIMRIISSIDVAAADASVALGEAPEGRRGAIRRARTRDVDADVDAVAHGPRESAAVDMTLPRL